MSESYKIIYLGRDFDFSNELKLFFSSSKNKIVISESLYTENILIKICALETPGIVFVDYSDKDLAAGSLLQEILFIKRTQQLKSILFVALLKSEEQKDELSYLYTSGFQLTHIKGTETDTLFRDSFFIGFREKVDFPVLAIAKDIYKDMSVGISSTLTSMNNTDFTIEADLENAEQDLSLTLPMFPDLKCDTFKIHSQASSVKLFPMTCSYTLPYPFPGAWDEESEGTLQPDTVETWLELNRDDFVEKMYFRVKIISRNLSLLPAIFENIDHDIIFDFGESGEELEAEILSSRPSLIFVDLDDEEGDIQLDILNFLCTNKLQEYEQPPFIIVLNCKSTTDALRKTFNYSMIIAAQNKLTAETVDHLATSLLKKKLTKGAPLSRDFVSISSHRLININQNMTITSLTEHEVTFLSDVELPMFSILNFKLPIRFHATIVPSFYELRKKENKFHYMAFINGLSEEQLMTLRKFINQVIYAPLSDFSPESVQSMMTAALSSTKPIVIKENPIEEVIIPIKAIEKNKTLITFKKSKL